MALESTYKAPSVTLTYWCEQKRSTGLPLKRRIQTSERFEKPESRETVRGNYRQLNLHLLAAGIAISCHRYLSRTCPKRPKLSLRALKGTFHVKIQLTAYYSRLWLVLYRLPLLRVWLY